jgi:hypothetical protein
MLSWLKGFAAPLAVLALTCLAPLAARADSVTYHTVVFFTAAGTNSTLATSTNTNDTLVDTSSGDKLVANSIAPTLVPLTPDGTPSPVTFGNFTMTGINAEQFVGASIEVDVYQDATSPPIGGNTGNSMFVGSATATFKAPPLGFLDTVILDFDSPLSFTLPSGAGGFPPHVLYRVDDQQTISPNGTFGHSDISGTVAEVPLPSTASIGFVLLAGLGGTSMLRRRRAIVA